MKIAVMQPYFFPYVGYFHLVNAVDKFIILDDVNYINRGWINRNRILVNGKQHLFTLPLKEVSQNKLINEIELLGDSKWQNNFIKTILFNYKRAPNFEPVYNLILDILKNENTNISKFVGNSIIKVSQYLHLNPEFAYSSDIIKSNNYKGQDKLIEICKLLGADNYINSFGGLKLYTKSDFEEYLVTLKFLKSNIIPYNQDQKAFVPNLSIIDVLMYNSPEELKQQLASYELI